MEVKWSQDVANGCTCGWDTDQLKFCHVTTEGARLLKLWIQLISSLFQVDHNSEQSLSDQSLVEDYLYKLLTDDPSTSGKQGEPFSMVSTNMTIKEMWHRSLALTYGSRCPADIWRRNTPFFLIYLQHCKTQVISLLRYRQRNLTMLLKDHEQSQYLWIFHPDIDITIKLS